VKESLINAPQRALDGFGQSARAACRVLEPSALEAQALFAQAERESMRVGFRGSGRSYGDPAINARELVLDLTRWNRVLSWDQVNGVVEVEPGVTVGDLWRHTLPDGFWPAVVPGTMAPTLGGCLAMNIHGKNNFRAGPIGDHVIDFDLLTPAGQLLRCSREQNPEVFRGAIGGLGLLGLFTRIRLRQTPVRSGQLRVEELCAATLDETFALFEERLSRSHYLVGWLDGLAGGKALGRSVVHQANYVEEVDSTAKETLRVERQGLPSRLFGVPRGQLWHFMRPLTNDLGLRILNAGKFWSAALKPWGRTYRQSHVAFAFLFDYLPNWRRIYQPRGFIQIQPFVPVAAAKETFREILTLCRSRGLPPYLVVLKRHRPDDFLLSHAVDGYSLAMDFPLPESREKLWALGGEITDRVLDRGGKFYFAKDSLLRPKDVARMFGPDRLEAFRSLKQRLDPKGILSSDLGRRVGLA
jgi:FAD/FMN-containing dehydrogenase